MSYKYNPFTGTLDDVGPNNGNGVPSGSDTQVQFNDGGVFGGDSGLTFNKTSNALSAGSFIPSSSTAPTNGVYLPAANSVAISTNGTGRLFIDASGNVGLGAANPVSNTGYGGLTMNGSNGAILSMSQAGTETFRVTNATGYTFINTVGATPLLFGTAANENMRLDLSGRLGLGTTSPSARLHVSGGDSVFGSTNIFRILSSGQVCDFSNAAQDAYVAGRINGLNLKFYTNTGSGIDIDSSGRVGIGTTSPGGSLHVAGTAILGDNGTNGRLTVETTTSTVGLFASTTGFGAYEDLELRGAVTIFKRDGTNESARLDGSGRLLVGTSTARSNFFNSATEFTPLLQVESAGAFTRFQSLIHNSNGSSATHFCFGKTRGTTVGSNTVVASGDDLGAVSFLGADGSEFVESARIQAQVDGTPGADDMPGRLVFSTTADSASSPTERMRIKSTGAIRCVTAFTVATLPAGEVGDLARVTDANAPSVGSTVAGGGAANALCWYNGTNWTVMGV